MNLNLSHTFFATKILLRLFIGIRLQLLGDCDSCHRLRSRWFKQYWVIDGDGRGVCVIIY